MKSLLLTLFIFFQFTAFAQKDCDYSTNVVDTIGAYKATKDYLVHERIFAGNSTYIFFSLVNVDGTPYLKVQTVNKSSDFIKAVCFDANSKIYLQLVNGKIITLVHTENETCGNMVRVEEEKKNTRILTGDFMFLKGSFEDLKSSPVSLIRIKSATDVQDYIFKKELVSELMNQTYYPENYFIDYIKCIENN
ncbi:hypothetical protein J2X31_001163 [Flavobacterium arsenatis]|uniref:Uncharacterized protein n=1 Tax=Flavobacterium arsenatis TaxID=1484332 RepID=A0ABU1TMG2_9FLAO|nr:hypothetical protein [Flavobacterium arsenatis]MDR6967156.1 hypothetical protein [Flavobacterium arsenatis]